MINNAIVKLVPHLPPKLVAKVAGRYIAGDTAAEALALAARLKEGGFGSTLDILGEDTLTRTQGEDAADDYIHLMKGMTHVNVSRNVSLKLTQLGLKLSQPVAVDNLNAILAIARETDTFVRIDMEHAGLTDVTLDIFEAATRVWPRVGTVLQARLKRTAEDARRLTGANIRLCKGAYRESPQISYRRKRDIRRSFMRTFRILMSREAYVGVATHDLRLINLVRREVERSRIPKDRLEFQSLLGVPIRSTLDRLKREGYEVRLYVPFGGASLAYSLRRLEENPGLAFAIAKSVFKRDRIDASKML